MPDTDKPVVFLIGNADGSTTEVSNDPRYHDEKLMEKILAERDNTGKATMNMGDLHAELGTGGEVSRATGQDAGTPPQRVTIAGVENGALDENSGSEDDERDDEDYSTWKAQELKAEVKKRQEAGRDIDTSGVTKKSQLVKLLEQDDEAQAAENQS